MTARHVVIIGNGPAANEAAISLRTQAPDARITIISKEPIRYYKPHLLPDLIAGKVSEQDLYVNPLEFYKENDIRLRLGQEVVHVSFATNEVVMEHKEVVRFDGLIIATGGKPRIPEPLQVFEDLMLSLKTLSDAKVWKERLRWVDSVLIVGGDLTSLSFTKAVLSLGKKVYFILHGDSFWPVRFNEELSSEVSQRLSDRGVEVISCRKILRLVMASEDSVEVETDGRKLRVGAIGAFFGLVPDVKFLARSGLAIERGIVVDEFLRTRFEGVYAAGDCAQVYHPKLRDYWVSIGYRNARNLGRVAALNLLGGQESAETAPAGIFQLDDISVNTSWWTEF
ncbi:MAG: FAD-dependent oxidoreductase [Desulfomonile tiedjei]|uniref:FAD-dependent oxidoreductase n=1 Tax=Desulfomonile tiedjei TaxID=2358 RepID=A0A9D6V1F4_9BACT|nr:FAD-dependent oxidoreductase [Desulfomonile tiedjei]